MLESLGSDLTTTKEKSISFPLPKHHSAQLQTLHLRYDHLCASEPILFETDTWLSWCLSHPYSRHTSLGDSSATPETTFSSLSC